MGIVIGAASLAVACGIFLLARGIYVVHVQKRSQSERHKIYILVGSCMIMGGCAMLVQFLMQGF